MFIATRFRILGVFLCIVLPLCVGIFYLSSHAVKMEDQTAIQGKEVHGLTILKKYMEYNVGVMSVLKAGGNKVEPFNTDPVKDVFKKIDWSVSEFESLEKEILRNDRSLDILNGFQDLIVLVATKSMMLYDADAVHYLLIDVATQKIPALNILVDNLLRMIDRGDPIGTKFSNIQFSIQKIKNHIDIAIKSIGEDENTAGNEKRMTEIKNKYDNAFKRINSNTKLLELNNADGLKEIKIFQKELNECWFDVVKIVEDNLKDEVRSSEKKWARDIAFSILLLMIAIVISYLNIAKFLSSPLKELMKNIGLIQENNEYRIKIKNKAEFGQIAAAFNKLLDEIKINIESSHEKLIKQKEQDAYLQKVEADNFREELVQIFQAAINGDFHDRITVEDKTTIQQQLCIDINEMMSSIENAMMDFSALLNDMAKGDLTKRITNDYKGIFDALKQDANATCEQLMKTIHDISVAAETLNAASGRMTKSSADLSESCELQTRSLEKTTASIEELTATISLNKSNASQVSTIARASKDKVARGGEISNASKSAMDTIEGFSKEIIKITEVIEGITFQTNLLALNASVEAVRAGEAGKGFSVVADEVRNLAKNSGTSSKQIRELIVTSNKKISDGAELVEETRTTLIELLGFVNNVLKLIEEIEDSTQEQSNGIDDINNAMLMLGEGTQANTALAQEAFIMADTLRNEANNLINTVQRFKIYHK
jgi:methyl-accepting chemotaxis protein